jgi:hypothetical protein
MQFNLRVHMNTLESWTGYCDKFLAIVDVLKMLLRLYNYYYLMMMMMMMMMIIIIIIQVKEDEMGRACSTHGRK